MKSLRGLAAAVAALLVAAPAHAGTLVIPIPAAFNGAAGFSYADNVGNTASGTAPNNGRVDTNIFGSVLTTQFGVLGADEGNPGSGDIAATSGTIVANAFSAASPFLSSTLINSLTSAVVQFQFAQVGTNGNPLSDIVIANVSTGFGVSLGTLPITGRALFGANGNILNALRTLGPGQYIVLYRYQETGTAATRALAFQNVTLTFVTPNAPATLGLAGVQGDGVTDSEDTTLLQTEGLADAAVVERIIKNTPVNKRPLEQAQ